MCHRADVCITVIPQSPGATPLREPLRFTFANRDYILGFRVARTLIHLESSLLLPHIVAPICQGANSASP